MILIALTFFVIAFVILFLFSSDTHQQSSQTSEQTPSSQPSYQTPNYTQSNIDTSAYPSEQEIRSLLLATPPYPITINKTYGTLYDELVKKWYVSSNCSKKEFTLYMNIINDLGQVIGTPEGLFAIICRESRFDKNAFRNDPANRDVGVGLGQINVQVGTLAYACSYAVGYNLFEKYPKFRTILSHYARSNINSQESIKRWAYQVEWEATMNEGGKKSLLWDPFFNIFASALYLAVIIDRNGVRPSDIEYLCFYYNAGHGQNPLNFSIWAEGRGKSYLQFVRGALNIYYSFKDRP